MRWILDERETILDTSWRVERPRDAVIKSLKCDVCTGHKAIMPIGESVLVREELAQDESETISIPDPSEAANPWVEWSDLTQRIEGTFEVIGLGDSQHALLYRIRRGSNIGPQSTPSAPTFEPVILEDFRRAIEEWLGMENEAIARLRKRIQELRQAKD